MQNKNWSITLQTKSGQWTLPTGFKVFTELHSDLLYWNSDTLHNVVTCYHSQQNYFLIHLQVVAATSLICERAELFKCVGVHVRICMFQSRYISTLHMTIQFQRNLKTDTKTIQHEMTKCYIFTKFSNTLFWVLFPITILLTQASYCCPITWEVIKLRRLVDNRFTTAIKIQ